MEEKQTPTKIIQISKDFIVDFYKKANADDRAWMKAKESEVKAEKGEDTYFTAFRAAFARKYFPSIISQKGRKKLSLGELFAEIDEQNADNE